MSTTDTSTAPASGIFMTAVRGWDRFWFHPADPTVLGFVRILVGLVALYVHFAYTGDLLDFVGPDGWVSKETFDIFRKDVASYGRHADWSDPNNESAAPVVDPDTGRPLELTPSQREYMKEWDGVDPRRAVVKGYWAWSIFYHVTDPTWIYIIHGCVLVIFFLFTIGLGTRVVSVLAWLATLSYIQRHYVAFFGMDTILSFATLYLMIGPSGAALSVDRLIARYARAWRALRARGSSRKATLANNDALKRAEGAELDPPQPRVTANLALRLLQVHICIVYFASGTAKLMGVSWWNGTAIWGTMINPEFSPVHNGMYMSALRWLCQHRALWELFMSGGVLFTLFFEISFAYLIWNRWTRVPMMIGAVMLHTGIAFFMGLTTFSLIMLASVAAFTPPELLQRLLRRLTRGREEMKLTYDPRDRAQVRSAALVRAFDPWNQVRAVDHAMLHEGEEAPADAVSAKPLNLNVTKGEGSSDEPVRLITSKGEMLTGSVALERLTRALHLLWPVKPLTLLPGALGLSRLFFPDHRASALTERRPKAEKVAH
jgi:hypothetical protein